MEYLNGQGGIETISKKYGVSPTPFRKWLAKYKAFGDSAFISTGHNPSYSVAFKREVINAYLLGEGSYREIAIKYQIPSEDTVRAWVLKYNGHEKLKASGTGGCQIMTKGRNTTFEERIEIVHIAFRMIITMLKQLKNIRYLINRPGTILSNMKTAEWRPSGTGVENVNL